MDLALEQHIALGDLEAKIELLVADVRSHLVTDPFFVEEPGDAHAEQTIALGPVASQEVIKQLGTNGGGFFNASSAHPFENPSAITNFFTLTLIWSIPAAITHTFGKMVGNTKQGWAIFGAMATLAVVGDRSRRYRDHERLGTAMLRAVGSDERTIAIVAGEPSPERHRIDAADDV